MGERGYLMEGEDEVIRLDLKTDGRVVEEQARWAGLRPGMRVADLGCGSGKTSRHLNAIAQPGGRTVGVDLAPQRTAYARKTYTGPGLRFVTRDIREPLDDLGPFDFIWVRFVLEYYRAKSFEVVQHVARALEPGGTLCLIDLDCNCLRFHGLGERLEQSIRGVMQRLETHRDFDPYVGVKLYSYLFDLGFEDIRVQVSPHNLVYSRFSENEKFNWRKKAEVAGRLSGYDFAEYPGGYPEFLVELERALTDPRVFTYTPLVVCCGRRAAAGATGPGIKCTGSGG